MRSTNFTVALADGTPDNLDQKFTVNIDTTDPDNLLRKVRQNTFRHHRKKQLLTYRAYLSDDLTGTSSGAGVQVESIAYNRGTATISAIAPKLNVNRAGELYTPK